jgi:hypothetical protein
VNQNSEVLIGTYSCSVSFEPPEAFAYVSFETSGDVFPHVPSLYRSFRGDAASPEVCDALVTAMAGVLGQASCSVSPIEASGDEGFAARDVRFVCHAQRSELIAVIARISTQHLLATP